MKKVWKIKSVCNKEENKKAFNGFNKTNDLQNEVKVEKSSTIRYN